MYTWNMGNVLKTRKNDASVEAFIESVENETRRSDGFTLLELYKKATGLEPKMWGDSIIGFGEYHYKSERSSQEGDWPLAGFSPRKANLTLYVMNQFANYTDLLSRLGKHKTSVACLYINKLADIDINVLEKLVSQSYEDAKQKLT